MTRRDDSKFNRWVVIGAVIALGALGVALPARAAELNFYEQADKRGCESIITERGQSDCAAVQKRKDEACNVAIECEVDKQERAIAKYKEAKERLDGGQVNEADKDKLASTVRDLKDELDQRKEAARKGASLAEACVRAREEVQKWFMETAISLTERTCDDSLRLRRDLLDKLADTQKKQADAKAQRDANSGDSSAQSDYDRTTSDMRDAEKALEQFNSKYGKDIERYASKLIDHYKAENASHEKPLQESKNRTENCKKIDNMSY
jgi:hypothetical protein